MDGAAPSSAGRSRANVAGLVCVAVTVVWALALVAGFDWWIAALVLGYVVLVPVVAVLFGGGPDEAREWRRSWLAALDPRNLGPPGDWSEHLRSDRRRTAGEVSTDDLDRDDALETLRIRYARGELTDEQFERELERLKAPGTSEDSAAGVRMGRDRGQTEYER